MRDERQELADARVQAARAGLACRVDALERRVVGAVDSATESVRETAGTIRSAVVEAKSGAQDLYHRAADGAKHMLDIPNQIRAHPWPSVGIATVAGFIAGAFRRNAIGAVEVIASRPSHAAQGLLGDLSAMVKRELRGLGEAAIVAASQAVKENIRTASESFASPGRHAHNGYHQDECVV